MIKMTEEETKEAEPTDPPNVSETEPTAPPEDLITKANAAAMRMETANKELKEQLDRQERMAVESKLGGKTEAGAIPKKEESDIDYAKKVMANDIETTRT